MSNAGLSGILPEAVTALRNSYSRTPTEDPRKASDISLLNEMSSLNGIMALWLTTENNNDSSPALTFYKKLDSLIFSQQTFLSKKEIVDLKQAVCGDFKEVLFKEVAAGISNDSVKSNVSTLVDQMQPPFSNEATPAEILFHQLNNAIDGVSPDSGALLQGLIKDGYPECFVDIPLGDLVAALAIQAGVQVRVLNEDENGELSPAIPVPPEVLAAVAPPNTPELTVAVEISEPESTVNRSKLAEIRSIIIKSETDKSYFHKLFEVIESVSEFLDIKSTGQTEIITEKHKEASSKIENFKKTVQEAFMHWQESLQGLALLPADTPVTDDIKYSPAEHIVNRLEALRGSDDVLSEEGFEFVSKLANEFLSINSYGRAFLGEQQDRSKTQGLKNAIVSVMNTEDKMILKENVPSNPVTALFIAIDSFLEGKNDLFKDESKGHLTNLKTILRRTHPNCFSFTDNPEHNALIRNGETLRQGVTILPVGPS
jgi:hypothetical protein